jgi:hypothetical protein
MHSEFLHAVFCYNVILNIKVIVSVFFVKLVCSFLIITKFQQDLIINVHRRSCMEQIILVIF